MGAVFEKIGLKKAPACMDMGIGQIASHALNSKSIESSSLETALAHGHAGLVHYAQTGRGHRNLIPASPVPVYWPVSGSRQEGGYLTYSGEKLKYLRFPKKLKCRTGAYLNPKECLKKGKSTLLKFLACTSYAYLRCF